MSTELVRYAASLPEKTQYAEHLAYSGLLPDVYRKQPANVLYAIEYGETLGISTMAAITGVNVIKGKPTASASLITALVRRAGHRLRIGYDAATMTGWAEIIRSDDPDFAFRSEWDLPRAVEAELCQVRDGRPFAVDKDGKSLPWKKFYPSMVKARAITEVARDACEEVLFGLHYTPDELGAELDADGSVLNQQYQRVVAEAQNDPAAVPGVEHTIDPTIGAEDGIEDAEVVETPAADATPSVSPPPAVSAPPASRAQIENIVAGLKAVRGIDNADGARQAINQIIAPRAIQSARDLTSVEADNVLNVLRAENEQKQEATAAPASPAPVGSPSNPVATEGDQKMMNGLLNKANYGRREDALWLISRILQRPVTTRAGMPRTDVRTVIAAVNRLIETGEMPPLWEPPAPPALDPAVFEELLHMLDEVEPGKEDAFNAAQAEIEAEFANGRISLEQVQTLRVRLADQTSRMAAAA